MLTIGSQPTISTTQQGPDAPSRDPKAAAKWCHDDGGGDLWCQQAAAGCAKVAYMTPEQLVASEGVQGAALAKAYCDEKARLERFFRADNPWMWAAIGGIAAAGVGSVVVVRRVRR